MNDLICPNNIAGASAERGGERPAECVSQKRQRKLTQIDLRALCENPMESYFMAF